MNVKYNGAAVSTRTETTNGHKLYRNYNSISSQNELLEYFLQLSCCNLTTKLMFRCVQGSIYLFIYLPLWTHLSIYLYTYLSICLSICLSISWVLYTGKVFMRTISCMAVRSVHTVTHTHSDLTSLRTGTSAAPPRMFSQLGFVRLLMTLGIQSKSNDYLTRI